ncbi:MAG: riboflavin synthase [Acidobacteriota bacterium]
MFSGMIAALGEVARLQRAAGGATLHIRCTFPGEALADGESIAVNGACLTVATPVDGGFIADLSAETLRRTTLGSLSVRAKVNLERALRLGDRLGGHLVLGHVDATARILELRREGGFQVMRVELPGSLAQEVAEKGSVAVDGVSLTVAGVHGGWFEVALIPTTLSSTTLGDRRVGDRVNLETDVLAKYVRRALGRGDGDVAAVWREWLGAEG